MSLDAALLKEALTVFVVELDENLQGIVDGLLSFEKHDGGSERRGEILNTIFRFAHNIKGNAGALGLVPVQRLSHQMENLLDILRQTQSIPTQDETDLCLSTCDTIRLAIEAILNETPPKDDVVDGMIAALQKAVAARQQGDIRQLKDGKQGATPPEKTPPEKMPPEKMTATKTEEKPEKQAEAAEQETTEPQKRTEEKPEQKTEPKGKNEVLVVAPVSSPPTAAAPVTVTPLKGGSDAGEIIRVSVASLDRVNGHAEDLLLSKIALETHMRTLHALRLQAESLLKTLRRRGDVVDPEVIETLADMAKGSGRLAGSLRTVSRQFALSLRAIEHDLRLLRLVPVATLLHPMARSVRDIARELGKKISFELLGEKTRIDRAVLDQLRDPFTHLLRNAIDHGIETPEDRRRISKPEEAGRIIVSVTAEGGSIVFRIADDGAGISAATVRAGGYPQKGRDRRGSGAHRWRHGDRSDLPSGLFQPGQCHRLFGTGRWP
ncbi:MAG: two-component system chemotaxis family sensor kinase CheA [Rhodospirillaceae bacterium]|nr:MAG: two-component system chemotaxis family sensor kinase CheA [Rhodospirillaceae bacterium]